MIWPQNENLKNLFGGGFVFVFLCVRVCVDLFMVVNFFFICDLYVKERERGERERKIERERES